MVFEKTFPIKIAFIILLVACLFVFGWLSADQESSLWSYSIWFAIIGLISLVVIIGDTAIVESRDKKKPQEIFETYVYEESFFTRLPIWAQLAIYVFVFAWGIVVFFQARGGFETISAPEYAVVGLGPVGNAFISAAAGLVENFAWFSVGPAIFGYVPFYFAFGGRKTEKMGLSRIMGIVGFLLVGTGLWIGYHWFRYGLADLSATIDVAQFAFFNLLWVVTTKNIVLPTVWHSFNNLGFRLKGVPVGFSGIFIPIFVAFAAIVVFNVWLYRRKGTSVRRGSWPKIFRMISGDYTLHYKCKLR